MDTSWVVYVAIALVGACIGSFACVIIDRLPLELDEPNELGETWDTRPWAEVVGGRSRCSSCGTDIAPAENVPVLAWLVLRGRCRHCGARIPAYLPLVEAMVPALAVWAVAVRGWTWTTAPILFLVVVGVIIAAIDIPTLIVPTRLVWPSFGVAVVMCVAIALGLGEPGWLVAALVGLACLAGPLGALWWIMPRGMGFGDVRLACLLGWTVGFEAAPGGLGVVAYSCLLVITIGALLGIVLGVVSVIAQFRKLRFVPFAPSLIAASYLVCLGVPRIREALGR